MQTQRQPDKHQPKAPPARSMVEPLAEDFFVGKTFTSKKAAYTLTKPLGSGGTSLVYLGTMSPLKTGTGDAQVQDVAVKLLSDASSQTDPHFRERFMLEAGALLRIRHPNVIRILDAGSSDGVLFLVTEFIPGLTLKDMLAAHNPLPMEYSREAVSQICAGLGAVHGIGLMYRDMKPGNVLCLGDRLEVPVEGQIIKIIDFGTVRPVRHIAPGVSLTGTGNIIGTPQYMAPEQFERAEYDNRVDIYSAGIVAYELITGQRPFSADNLAILIRMHIADKPIPPSEMAPDREIPKQVDAVVLKALAKKPGDRFQSIGDFGAAFRYAWEANAPAASRREAPPEAGAAPKDAAAERPPRRRQLKKAPKMQSIRYPMPRVKKSNNYWLKAGVAALAGLAVAAGALSAIQMRQNQIEQRRETVRQEAEKKAAEAARQAAEKSREYQATIETTPSGASVSRLIREGGNAREVREGATPFNATLRDSAEYIVRYRGQHQHIAISRDTPCRKISFKTQKKPHRAGK